ncbi:MAG: TetR/AcrR family transcriptional regulator [Actinomycetota bacterium]|nr:TetR/AcrR family transcriptional regulator [Actinomycetota bacterium]
MPVKPGAEIDPAATRSRIMEISERIFSQRGIAAVGVADIAVEARASKASIYKNFGSKDGLVEATLAYRSEHVHRWLTEGTAQLPPGRERILGVFDLLLEWYAQDDFRGCAILNAAAEQRASNPTVTRLARQHLQAYRDFLTASLTEAAFPDPQHLAAQLLILIEGATVISAIDGAPTAGQQARALADRLLTAEAKRTPTRRRSAPQR